MGAIFVSRYDPKRFYLFFLLSFAIYTFFNISSWKFQDSGGHTSCLRNEVLTGPERLQVTTSKDYLFVITPTYRRLTQLPDAVRLKQALLLVPNVVWIVVEDSHCRHEDVYSYIKDFPRLIYVNQKLESGPSSYNKGAEQRNFAIRLLRQHFGHLHNSVVYFADDDNTYNSNLLSRLTLTKQLSVFNVGLINEEIEGPIVDQSGVFVRWHTRYLGRFFNRERMFCIDMAGFAVSLPLLLDTNALFDARGTRGYLETDFLELLKVPLRDLEVLTNNHSEIVAWHTKTSYMIANYRLLSYIHRLLNIATLFLFAYILFIFFFYRIRCHAPSHDNTQTYNYYPAHSPHTYSATAAASH